MSIEIGELVIRTEVVDRVPMEGNSVFQSLSGGWTRMEEAELIDEIVRRVLEKLQDQWRERL